MEHDIIATYEKAIVCLSKAAFAKKATLHMLEAKYDGAESQELDEVRDEIVQLECEREKLTTTFNTLEDDRVEELVAFFRECQRVQEVQSAAFLNGDDQIELF